MTFLAEQRPAYVVLRQGEWVPGQRYIWVPPGEDQFLAWVDHDTELLGTIDDRFYGPLEVRRALRWPDRDTVVTNGPR